MPKFFHFDEDITQSERDESIRELAKLLSSVSKIAFLTGAGISTESGLPDFRSSTGIYQTTSEELFSIDGFLENTENFYKRFAPFYRSTIDAKPNAGHQAIVELERRCGKDVEVVTQNIDALHSVAGTSKVWEIHGTLRTASCIACEKTYKEEFFREDMLAGRVPKCACGGILKPDITFYGELLPERALNAARRAMWETKALIILGTSLQVNPAAALPRDCDAGVPFVVVNKTSTAIDFQASLVFRAAIGDVLPQAVALVPDSSKNPWD